MDSDRDKFFALHYHHDENQGAIQMNDDSLLILTAYRYLLCSFSFTFSCDAECTLQWLPRDVVWLLLASRDMVEEYDLSIEIPLSAKNKCEPMQGAPRNSYCFLRPLTHDRLSSAFSDHLIFLAHS